MLTIMYFFYCLILSVLLSTAIAQSFSDNVDDHQFTTRGLETWTSLLNPTKIKSNLKRIIPKPGSTSEGDPPRESTTKPPTVDPKHANHLGTGSSFLAMHNAKSEWKVESTSSGWTGRQREKQEEAIRNRMLGFLKGKAENDSEVGGIRKVTKPNGRTVLQKDPRLNPNVIKAEKELTNGFIGKQTDVSVELGPKEKKPRDLDAWDIDAFVNGIGY